MSTIIKENPIFVFSEGKPEDSIGVGSSIQYGLTSLTVTFPDIGDEEHTSEDEADIEVMQARENEPTEPLEDVIKELGLDE